MTNAYLFEAENSMRHDHFLLGFTINWEPTVTTHRIAFGWDYTDRNGRFVRNFQDLRSPAGFLTDYNTYHTKLSIDYTGSWRTNFGANWLSTLSWGGQVFQDKHRYLSLDSTLHMELAPFTDISGTIFTHSDMSARIDTGARPRRSHDTGESNGARASRALVRRRAGLATEDSSCGRHLLGTSHG